MVSLTGERYADLPNAFRYRSEYLNACACGPKPWSAEAKAQYERRAVLATRSRPRAGRRRRQRDRQPPGRQPTCKSRSARRACGMRPRGPRPSSIAGCSAGCAPRATARRPATISRCAASSCSAAAKPSRRSSARGLARPGVACHVTPHGKASSPVRLSRQYLPLAHGRRRVPPRRRGRGRRRPLRDRLGRHGRLAYRPGARHARTSRRAESRHGHLGPERAAGRGRPIIAASI